MYVKGTVKFKIVNDGYQLYDVYITRLVCRILSKKCHRRSPERGARFPEWRTLFPERDTWFPEWGTLFPERGTRFPEWGTRFFSSKYNGMINYLNKNIPLHFPVGSGLETV